MTTEITKQLMCISLRNGVEIWIEKERIENLIISLEKKDRGFFQVGDELINIVDIIGIFTPERMEETTRRKNGEWRCKHNYWHQRGKVCDCTPIDPVTGKKFIMGVGWV